MLIAVPKEIKKGEYRVGMVPSSVHELTAYGHTVLVESGAGDGIGFRDKFYQDAGAKIVASAKEIFAKADLIVKIKEPSESERKQLHQGQVLFAYLHLAPDPHQAKDLIESHCTAIAYETVTDNVGGLPLLSPMSEVAGRLSVQAGAHCLEKPSGGSGILLGGVPGVARGNVTIIGGGVVGTNAARMAMGKEAHVTVLDKSLERLKELDYQFGAKLNVIYATRAAIAEHVIKADLVIGAILLPGRATTKVVSHEILRSMRHGSVVVDVSIDQGGCFETSRPTSHDAPTYVVDGIVHYCVTNMPGAVPRTATFALNNATLPFILAVANKGYQRALLEDENLLNGLNVHRGQVTNLAVAEDLGLEYTPARAALELGAK